MNFSILGMLVFVFLLFPNILYAIFPMKKERKKKKLQAKRSYVLCEQIGRIGCMLGIVFSGVGKNYNPYLFSLISLCMLMYYIAWLRYFLKDRKERYLYVSVIKIPVPLAVFPVLVFFFFSLLSNSVLLGIFSICFGIGHITITIDKKKALV